MTIPDQAVLRRKVLLKLLATPVALVPTLAGASALAVSWAANLPEWATFGGGVAVLLGLGAYVTRAIFGIDDATRESIDELKRDERAAWEARLDDLDARLLTDRDPRTEVLLRRLRELAREVEDKGLGEGVHRRTRIEITMQVAELFEECVHALEKSLDLWERAQRVEDTKARAAVYDAREAEINEVAECVKVLERLVGVELATVGASRRDGNLARIREELRQSLDVARRVEERMKSLEGGMPEDRETGS
jgi:hypothetical protein